MNDNQSGTGPGATTRRGLILGAGAVGASVVLTACGGGSPPGGRPPTGGGGTPTGGGGTPTGGTSPTPGGTPSRSLAKGSDIPVGGGRIFAAQSVVVTQPKAGEFKGFSNICTHQNCPVAAVEDGTINCNCHGSKFSIEDGSVKAGPAQRPLPAKQIKVEGSAVTLA